VLRLDDEMAIDETKAHQGDLAVLACPCREHDKIASAGAAGLDQRRR